MLSKFCKNINCKVFEQQKKEKYIKTVFLDNEIEQVEIESCENCRAYKFAEFLIENGEINC